LTTSFLATKNHQWLIGVPQSPNDLAFQLNDTWQWTYRVAGSYRLPLDIQLSARDEGFSGLPGQRSVLFSGVPQSGTLTLPVEPFGAERGPTRNIVTARAAKRWRFGRRAAVEFDVDGLNLTNTNVAWGSSTGGQGAGINFQSGPSYGYVVRI